MSSSVHTGVALTKPKHRGTVQVLRSVAALELAKGCPILDVGGSVEVRPIEKLNM